MLHNHSAEIKNLNGGNEKPYETATFCQAAPEWLPDWADPAANQRRERRRRRFNDLQ
jgi:hypothetical protein